MPLTVQPIRPEFGAEISGINLSMPISVDIKQKLNDLLAQYAVLVFRNQSLSPPQFMSAAEIFGELMDQQLKKYVLPDYPMVGCNSTDDLPRKNGKLQVRGENYHTDHSNEHCPPKATTLHALRIPPTGGDTQFVDVRQAYDDLPAEIKKKLKGLFSLHVHQSSRSPRELTKLSPEELAKIPTALQPLVISHPGNNRPALYLNTGRMEGIEGMDPDEGYALIQDLYNHATDARYEYRHKWREGDMVIWDNQAVMHQANADYDPEQKRFLYRLMIKGVALTPALT
ncbi:TauD/TfdA dioxygenase family protein [Zwartia vadi]|uniref:TauD/TfdA dioxygenase family protein n=1 Tax=Zwartia vadi TaxID=3058168 RepID=UPI0025B45174|nr:TauD/TfdA family dioxygenase [Zwartia vadi]MDN3987220.1 TauD/TfdA family dioxygenase [Zwartia vadi]